MSLSEQDVPEAGGGRGFSINVRYLRAVGENAVLDCVGHPHCVSMPFLLLWVTEGDRKRGWNDRPCASKFDSPDLSRLSGDGRYRWTAAEPGKGLARILP